MNEVTLNETNLQPEHVTDEEIVKALAVLLQGFEQGSEVLENISLQMGPGNLNPKLGE